MKIKIFLLCATLFVLNAGAQNVKYVNTILPLKEKKLVSAKVAGGIDDLIYVTTTQVFPNKNLRISSYNKETSQLIKTLPVKGFGNPTTNTLLSNAYFFKINIRNNMLYITWINETQLLLQVLDKDLVEVQAPKVIYQKDNNSSKFNSLFFFMSPNGDKMIVGGENAITKTENVRVQYKVLNKNMEVENTIQAELPFSVNRSTYGNFAGYEMDNNGFLYFLVNLNLNNEKKESKKQIGQLIGSINPETSEVKTQMFSFADKTIYNASFEIMNDHLFLVGTYFVKNRKKSKDVEHNNGVFTAKIDKFSFENIGDPIFNELDETKVAFSNYKMSSSKKENYSVGEYAVKRMLKYDFKVTDYMKTDDNGLVMSINSQVYSTVCSNKGGCSYYTDLLGVNYIKINAQGEIDWISCTEQKMTYSGWIVPENKLSYKDGIYHTVVRSAYNYNTSYVIEDKTGQVKLAKMKNKYIQEESNAVNDQLYFVGLSRKMSSLGIKFLSIGLVAIPISLLALSSPFSYIGMSVGIVMSGISLLMKRHNVDFGKYELQN